MNDVITLQELKTFLLYSTLISYGFLLLWFAAMVWARDAVYRLHSRWFTISREHFDALHYAGMMLFKLGLALAFLIPLLSVCLMS